MLEKMAPEMALYGCAWLLFLVVRSGDITIVVKSKEERTGDEQKRVARGLLRSILLEALLFVPASATMVLLLAPLLVPERLKAVTIPQVSLYAALGLISYGFPFASVRHMITRIALRTLQEFAAITQEPPKEKDGK
ncbi:MAG: hypothetical protein NTZ17_10020 [Phycisphaerae bacterium]|nr:hypothetical protein [Phycisphaerae bacterium]